MTRKEYFEVIESMRNQCSMLHISETRVRLDLADWIEQVCYLCKLAEDANKIIDVDRQSMLISIDNWFELRGLYHDLNDVMYGLSLVVCNMEEGRLPSEISGWDEEKEELCYDVMERSKQSVC